MKAVLVVDIPNSYGDVYDNKAVVTLRNGKLGTSLGIYNVPLRPLPQKKPVNTNDLLANAEAFGWNVCLYVITGEQNERL